MRASAKHQDTFTHVTAIGCYCNGKPCTPYQMFDLAYSELDDLIAYNRSEQKRSTKTNYVPNNIQAERQKRFSKWEQSIPESLYVKLLVEDEKSSRYLDLKVTPRIRMPIYKDRRPNILFLDDEKHSMIMRMSRTYLPGKREGNHNFKSLQRNHFKKLDTNHLLDWIEKGNLRESKKHSYQYIPEPYLITALEEMYKEGFPRITPQVKTVDQKGLNLVTIRPMLMPAWDYPLNSGMQRKFGEYLGSLYGLQILEKADRQLDHYTIQQPNNHQSYIVNFDPDFYVRAHFPEKTLDQILRQDFNDFEQVLQKEANEEDFFVSKEVIEKIREHANNFKQEDKLKYFGKHFLEFLPASLENAGLPGPIDSLTGNNF